MYVPTNTPKYVCAGCRNKIPIVDLENIFLEELKSYLLSPEKISAYLAGADQTLAEKTRLLGSLRKEHQKVKQEADQAYRLYLEGALTVPQFKEIYQLLDARKHQIEEEMPRTEAEIDLLKIDSLSREHIITEAKDLHSRWPKMTLNERLNIVQVLVKNITIGKGDVSLNLYYLPGFEEMTNEQRLL
jgi:site-specific DNA recombinase